MPGLDQLTALATQRTITRTAPVKRTARVQQVESLFDVPPSLESRETWDVNLPLDAQDWRIGLIVGPSGAGKTTVARECFGDAVRDGYHDWSPDHAIIDSFPDTLSIKEVTAALGAVGFGSPPNWLRPFHVLSNGEQFRATVARALCEPDDLIVIDEFTSVVDRQVAQIASHCIAKAVRKSAAKRFVAVTCHYDVLDWLQPDWVYQPHVAQFDWRALQRRPALDLAIYPVGAAAWRLFSKYHYLSGELNHAAQCFGAFIHGECVAFTSYLHMPHPKTRNIKVGHRLVVRPDYQGLGIGGRLDDWLGQYLYERGYRYHNTVAHPAMIAYYSRSPRWRNTQSNGIRSRGNQKGLDVFSPVVAPTAGTSPYVAGKMRTLNKSNQRIGTASVLPGLNTSDLQSGPRADVTLRRKQAIIRRVNTQTFEYVPPRVVSEAT